MAETSEARKRKAERTAAEHERRRDVCQQALAEVYSGATYVEADAFLDHLDDLDASVVVW